MNKKGITLITVVVIIIVIIIIATVSIVSGNKLIINARNLTNTQREESVREAMLRRRAEINMQGIIVPKGDSYPGSVDPLIGDGTYRAIGWYTLDEAELNELGVKDVTGRFLVNYDYMVALDMSQNDYLDRYFAYVFMYKVDNKVFNDTTGTAQYIGTRLFDRTSGDEDLHSIYVDTTDEMEYDYFGTGWYAVKSRQIAEELDEDYEIDLFQTITNSFLINYEDKKVVKITSKFYYDGTNM